MKPMSSTKCGNSAIFSAVSRTGNTFPSPPSIPSVITFQLIFSRGVCFLFHRGNQALQNLLPASFYWTWTSVHKCTHFFPPPSFWSQFLHQIDGQRYRCCIEAIGLISWERKTWLGMGPTGHDPWMHFWRWGEACNHWILLSRAECCSPDFDIPALCSKAFCPYLHFL